MPSLFYYAFKSLAVVIFALIHVSEARDPNDCEVCVSALETVVKTFKTPAPKMTLVEIEEAVGAYCEKPPSEKFAKLCYYVDPIKREISQPLKNGVPVKIVCERLKKKSAEICALKFQDTPKEPTKIDSNTDFSKLKVAQLKAIIAEKNIPCPSCLEKDDFIVHIKAKMSEKGGEL